MTLIPEQDPDTARIDEPKPAGECHAPFRPADGRVRRVIYRLICSLPLLLPTLMTAWKWQTGQFNSPWNEGGLIIALQGALAIAVGVLLVLPQFWLRMLGLSMFFLDAMNGVSGVVVEICNGWLIFLVYNGGFDPLLLLLILASLATLATPVIALLLMRLELEREWRRRQVTPKAHIGPLPEPLDRLTSRWKGIGWWALFLLPLLAGLAGPATRMVQLAMHSDQMPWGMFWRNFLTVVGIGGFAAWALLGRRPHWRLLLYGVLLWEFVGRLINWIPMLIVADWTYTTGQFLWTGIPDPHWVISATWFVLVMVGMGFSMMLVHRLMRTDLEQMQLIQALPEREDDLGAPGWDEAGKVG